MGALKDLQAIYSVISALGFPFMLFIALAGTKLRVWYWAWYVLDLVKQATEQKTEFEARITKLEKQCTDQKTEYEARMDEQAKDYEARLAKTELLVDRQAASTEKWQGIALDAVGMNKTQLDIIKSRAA